MVHIYDESDVNNPLEEEGTGIVDITGSDGQEDEVVESAITANRAVGKDVVGYRERSRLRLNRPGPERARKTCIGD